MDATLVVGLNLALIWPKFKEIDNTDNIGPFAERKFKFGSNCFSYKTCLILLPSHQKVTSYFLCSFCCCYFCILYLIYSLVCVVVNFFCIFVGHGVVIVVCSLWYRRSSVCIAFLVAQ